jgi:hypothetical protein
LWIAYWILFQSGGTWFFKLFVLSILQPIDGLDYFEWFERLQLCLAGKCSRHAYEELVSRQTIQDKKLGITFYAIMIENGSKLILC